MAQDEKFRDILDTLVHAEIVNHILEVPVPDSTTETTLLDEVNKIIAAPLIRLTQGRYAFLMDASDGPQICQALENLDGTLRGISLGEPPLEPINTAQRELVQTLLDAALIDVPKNVLDAGFLINAARLGQGQPNSVSPTPPEFDPSENFKKIEESLADLNIQPALEQISGRLDCLEKLVSGEEFIGPKFVPSAELNAHQDQRLDALKQQIEEISVLKASVELLDAQISALQDEKAQQPQTEKIEVLLNSALAPFTEKLDHLNASFEIATEALRQDMVSLAKIPDQIAEASTVQATPPEFAEILQKLEEFTHLFPALGFEQKIETQIEEVLATMNVAQKGERMKLISDGERLSRITKGLQVVLERMAGQTDDLHSHQLDTKKSNIGAEERQDMEIRLQQQLTQFPPSDITLLISNNLPQFAELLVENPNSRRDQVTDFAPEGTTPQESAEQQEILPAEDGKDDLEINNFTDVQELSEPITQQAKEAIDDHTEAESSPQPTESDEPDPAQSADSAEFEPQDLASRENEDVAVKVAS